MLTREVKGLPVLKIIEKSNGINQPMKFYLDMWLLGAHTCIHIARFIQSLEFLKKSSDLPSSFPDLEKVWKIFLKLQQVLYKFFFFFPFCLSLIQSCLYVCTRHSSSIDIDI